MTDGRKLLNEATLDELRARVRILEDEEAATALAASAKKRLELKKRHEAREQELRDRVWDLVMTKTATEGFACPACGARKGKRCGSRDSDTHVQRISRVVLKDVALACVKRNPYIFGPKSKEFLAGMKACVTGEHPDMQCPGDHGK